MKLTSAQKMRIERLYENESLTDNLVDSDARAVLKWAENQLLSNTAELRVQGAVRAANHSGAKGADALIAVANSYLAQPQTPAPASAASPTTLTSDSLTQPSDPSPALTAPPDTASSAPPPTSSAPTALPPSPPNAPPAKKPRRSAKRSKK